MTSTFRTFFTDPLVRAGGALAIAASLTAPTLLSADDGSRPASAEEIRELAQAVAMCPSLSPEVAQILENSLGEPSSAEARKMKHAATECVKLHRRMPKSMQRASAMAALQSSIEANTYHLPDARPAGPLKLSLKLGEV